MNTHKNLGNIKCCNWKLVGSQSTTEKNETSEIQRKLTNHCVWDFQWLHAINHGSSASSTHFLDKSHPLLFPTISPTSLNSLCRPVDSLSSQSRYNYWVIEKCLIILKFVYTCELSMKLKKFLLRIFWQFLASWSKFFRSSFPKLQLFATNHAKVFFGEDGKEFMRRYYFANPLRNELLNLSTYIINFNLIPLYY